MKRRDSFIFYRSFFEAIQNLDTESQGKIYHAIADYCLNQKSPKFSGVCQTVWILIKPQLDANYERFKNGSKPKAKPKQTESKTEANKNVNVNHNVNHNENKNVNDIPTFDVFQNYAISKKPKVCLDALKLKYDVWVESNWHDGNGSKIINWKTKLLNTLPFISEKKWTPEKNEGLSEEEKKRNANRSAL